MELEVDIKTAFIIKKGERRIDWETEVAWEEEEEGYASSYNGSIVFSKGCIQ